MKNKYDDITKKDIDWLWSAIDTYDRQILYISDKGALATDGIRMHAINPEELPDQINGIDKEKLLSKTIRIEKVLSEFSINPEILIGALKGFYRRVKIELVGDSEFSGIKISDGSDKVAFIACMHEDENENEE